MSNLALIHYTWIVSIHHPVLSRWMIDHQASILYTKYYAIKLLLF